MKKIGNFFKYIYNQTHKGFYFLCLVFSRGFYFYFYLVACLLRLIFPKMEWSKKLVDHYKDRQEKPEYFFLILFASVLLIATIYVVFYDSNEVVKLDEMIEEKVEIDASEEVNTEEVMQDATSTQPLETNLYKIYGNKSISEINFNELKLVNSEVKAWLIVDGTNINYPVVQAVDNDYYLMRNIYKKKTSHGWPFIDYRNDSTMSDDNTIFYGHNLLNKTAFGSVSNLFTKEWLNNSSHKILVLTESKIYTYEIFSIYYSDPNSYYLQTSFTSDNSRLTFYNNLKSKSSVELNVEVSAKDKIITLSTCTEDNKGRKVVHAKLVSEAYR